MVLVVPRCGSLLDLHSSWTVVARLISFSTTEALRQATTPFSRIISSYLIINGPFSCFWVICPLFFVPFNPLHGAICFRLRSIYKLFAASSPHDLTPPCIIIIPIDAFCSSTKFLESKRIRGKISKCAYFLF